MNLGSVNKLNKKPNNFLEEASLLIGDIVFTMTGNIGRVALVDQENLLQNQRIGKIILKKDNHRPFYYFLLRNAIYKNTMINLAHGTAQPNLGKSDFLKILFPYNLEVIKKFSNKTENFVKLIIHLRMQNKILTETRDTLLPKLMSGEIDVSNIKVE